jgi:hypothetical protein
VAELREAVETFVDLYSDQWMPEKNGFLSPSATRQVYGTLAKLRGSPRKAVPCPSIRVRYASLPREVRQDRRNARDRLGD